MKDYLVCYDISSDKERLKVMKTLRGMGYHAQLSFFEVSAGSSEEILNNVRYFITGADRLAIIRLGNRDKIKRIGGLLEGMRWVL